MTAIRYALNVLSLWVQRKISYRAIPWGIGATVAVALVVAASYFDRFIDRKYLSNQRRK